MENATADELHAQAAQQWREVVVLGLHDAEDLAYGIIPLLVQALALNPNHLPSLDLLSDLLMEIDACEEAIESAEKMQALAPDHADAQKKLAALHSDEENQRRLVRAYLRQKRLQLTRTPPATENGA